MNQISGTARLAPDAAPQEWEGLSLVRGPPLSEEPGLGALTIPGYLREVTRRYASREAAVMRRPDGPAERWSYADVWDHAVEVARALIAAGVTKDTRVGILMSNRLEYLSALYGAALAGGVAVALSTFSTPSELAYLLQASSVDILLFERQVVKRDFVAMLGELEPKAAGEARPIASTAFPFLERLVALESVSATGAQDAPLPGAIERWEDFLAAGAVIAPEAVEARAATVKPSDTGMLFFSSGTTSLPKGILHAQRALAVQWWRWPRIMRVVPEHPVRSWTGNGFFWSGNLSMVIGNAWSSGGAVVLQPTFEADEALRLIKAERVSFVTGRPHQWARLQASPLWAEADISSLHYVTYNDILASHPSFDTPWTTPLSFGTTETLTVIATVADSPEDEAAGGHGRPLPGNILKIFDPLDGRIVARGERGEIGVKGPTLMLGYVGKTLDETFDEDGYYRTGDGGYFDAEGRLFWEGRLTDIIKTGGANVSPLEVDAALSNCPGVKRGVTVGVPHETLGEMVVACIVPHEGASLAEDEVRAFLKARLASYKAPRAVLFFREEDFAVTGNEKIKTAALRELARARLGGPTARLRIESLKLDRRSIAMSVATYEAPVTLDTTDVDKWVGKPVVFAEMWDPCNATDIRRWVQALDYPNPIHWDEESARKSRFGGIVAPQSFTVCMDYGHGCHPSCVGKVPGTHLIFAGEEWWFYGPRIKPGDKLTQERRFDGYSVSETSFAGPTMFARGDTVHTNQNGERVAKERATSIRYLVEEANKRGVYAKEKRAPKRWTKDELKAVNELRHQWILSNREGRSPKFSEVKVGDKLPRRVIGPHSVVSFANECRAHRQNIWGTWRWNPPDDVHDPAKEDAGFGADMTYDHEMRKIDPRHGDGLYHGPSSGHINAEKAENVGMGGAYGYGASMNAWFLDTIAYWAGSDGFIWHSKTQFRSPAFEGDVTYVDGEVVDKQQTSEYGAPVVQVALKMVTQTGDTILTGKAEVGLPA